jgi:hypothetical protein
MPRLTLFLTVCLVTILTACVPAAPGTTPTGFKPSIAGTDSAITASVATVLPVMITLLPPDYTPFPTSVALTPTPIPPLPSGTGPSELKYRILAQFPDLFFCDPDFYPVARADEADLARQHFPELQANPEEFDTILSHNHLAGVSTYTDEQKLLIYREHKKLAAVQIELAGSRYQFQIQVLKTDGQGESISGSIDGKGEITVEQREPGIATCPICLAEGTLIDTPAGALPVQNLRAGMLVWTAERAGVRVAKPVMQIGKTVVPATHKVVHLMLEDGRELWVSPGHPTVDGRRVRQLQAGDPLDGGIIRSATLVRYTSYASYDLLPAGETGFYWANGILLASTLEDGSKYRQGK